MNTTSDSLLDHENSDDGSSNASHTSIQMNEGDKKEELESSHTSHSMLKKDTYVPLQKFSLVHRLVSRWTSPQGRSHQARNAFHTRDAETSRKIHESPNEEPHGGVASDYIKAIVFGALDGILTTFAIITAAQGGYGDNEKAISNTILVLGFANNLADAFAMGFGEYMSSSAEIDHVRAERRREEWEVETNIEGEKREMIDLYVKKGLGEGDARTVVDIISKDKKLFVDIMMAEELELLSSDADESASGRPIRQGIVIFVSFFLFGSIPLMAYVTGRADNRTFGISCALVGVSLFFLGSVKGRLTNMNTIYAGMVMLFTGCVVASISYAIGAFCSYLFQIKDNI
ncbi:vacuolar iron family transporter [Perkinsela sp. CCAP 1560/4]|nr:vacuolar iron family transporter [Perkinsela sp. CCAP 1560/4]|eukprot:KNH08202.1 vacuolar iron family transporter [Perkinsela sp. CCAP 1560/4]